uniref:VLRF1 domain-containing protein n=1 Tax=Kalanchoe fedtschenkoi TaxID=63787 RepID=A0A7N0TDI7_KALFE
MKQRSEEKRSVSVFDVPGDFFDGCRLLPSPSSSISDEVIEAAAVGEDAEVENLNFGVAGNSNRWSCNACKAEFESLQEQRAHFKSDFHRFNIKLTIAGKAVVKEEDFDELNPDSLLKDYDVSSISGSDEEDDREPLPSDNKKRGATAKKLYIQHQNGNKYSVWKSLLLDDSDNVLYGSENVDPIDSATAKYFREVEVIEKLKSLVHEPRDSTCMRVVLLASGGHFAGCVFDGNSIVAHKTFHRYVVRAKAGKKQSSKDASGRAAHSAGASLRRYNELALKKNIQDLLALWKPYFDASACSYISAPSDNRQLLFNGEKPLFSQQHGAVRHVPLNVRRPTLKEAKRIYQQLTQVSSEVDPTENGEGLEIRKADENPSANENTERCDSLVSRKVGLEEKLETFKDTESSSSLEKFDQLSLSVEHEPVGRRTPLHEAAHLGKVDEVMLLLEQGLDPCIKDERGRTPYMVATDKEVRNTFRRFMASNLDKWDWQAANVPSVLTKEMEEAQAAKQAEKDAKRKARAKELKKLKKAREKEKKEQEQIALQNAKPEHQAGSSSSKKQSQSIGGPKLSKEEELKRAQAAEREKRAAAAEKRMMAAAAAASGGSYLPPNSVGGDAVCSCCSKSLAGLVPFHRYDYKYCSTSCMRVHKELIDSGC